jgi:(R,R)-butanediol dehydrogenase / meso-butanediol dehydrogenase / diacetyl reductase
MRSGKMKFKGRAMYWNGPDSISEGEIIIDNVNDDEAVVKVSYCGICGTDISIFAGNHPRSKPPLVLGHEFSGIIEYAKSPKLKKGNKVVINPLISCGKCWPCTNGSPYVCQNLRLVGIDFNGGFATYAKVNIKNILKLSNDYDLLYAAIIEPFATAIHSFNRSKPVNENDFIFIFGGGAIGSAVAFYFKSKGLNRIYVSEISDYRRKVLEKFGLNVINPVSEDIYQKVLKLTSDELADIVIEATGAIKPISQMVSLSKVKGKIMIVGVNHKPVSVDLMNVNFKELSLIGCRVYSVKDFLESVNFIKDNKGLLKNYISHVLDLKDLKKGINLAKDIKNSLKVVIKVA